MIIFREGVEGLLHVNFRLFATKSSSMIYSAGTTVTGISEFSITDWVTLPKRAFPVGLRFRPLITILSALSSVAKSVILSATGS